MNPPLYRFNHLRRAFAGVILAGATTSGAFANVVTDWNTTLEAALRNPTPSVPAQARASAIVHVAMFEAINGITQRYAPLRVTDPAPAAARADVAGVYAAYVTLVNLFPGKQATFDAQLLASLSTIPGAGSNSAAVAAGRAWGEFVAGQILAWRANDGFSQSMTYPGSTDVGHWRHPPLTGAPAGALSMSVTQPFALANPATFDPGPPYGTSDRAAALATLAYAADLEEVKQRGGMVSLVRTPAQAALALLIHLCDVPDINAIVRRTLPTPMHLDETARVFALLNMTASDAAVVCFQAKYKYGFWRPLQAIPYADLDGNPTTIADPAWQPLGPTPSHPEYLSGHSTISGAMLAMAAVLLGDETTFTVTTSNPGGPGITPQFTSFSEFSDAIVEGRIDMGFHFRNACEMGQHTGASVAREIARTALLPLHGTPTRARAGRAIHEQARGEHDLPVPRLHAPRRRP